MTEQADDPSGGEQRAGTTCPACGVAVAPGYPRCPKCHAELAHGRSMTTNPSAQRIQGGTSTAAETPRSWPWIAAAAGLAVLGVIGVFVLRGSEKHAAPPPPAPSPAPAAVAPNTAGAVPDPDVAPEPSAPQEPPEAQQRWEASSSLQQELDNRRLWATVDTNGTDLSIHSAYCNDAAMAEAIDGLVKELGSAGITHVGCYERHGPLVFERAISRPAGGQ